MVEAFEWFLIAVGFVVLFAALPHALANDDVTRLADIEGLLHHAQLSSSRYSLVMPLFSSPFLLIGEIVKSPAWWAERFNVLVVLAGTFVVWRLLRPTVDARLMRWVLLVLLFASFLTNRLRDYNAEILTATLVTVGVVMLVLGRHRRLGWLALIVGVVNTPATLLGLAAIAGAEAIRTRRIRCFAPLVVAAFVDHARGVDSPRWATRHGVRERPRLSNDPALLGPARIQLPVDLRCRVDSLFVRSRARVLCPGTPPVGQPK